MKELLKKIFGIKVVKTTPFDPFIERLPSSVIGGEMLHKGNIYLMDHAIQHMPENGHVLEIGSYGGLSTNLLTYLVKKYDRNAAVYSCDPWIYEGYDDRLHAHQKHMDGRKDISRKDYMDHIKRSFIKSTQLLSKQQLPYTIEMTSDDFFSAYKNERVVEDVFDRNVQLGGPISFCYIDGNHAYDYVKRDLLNLIPHLAPKAFILFDDSADDANFGSAKLMKEVKKDIRFKLADKNPNYLFQYR